jgi:DNA-binding CsgD family transcriptional regulator/PAS domain-containing protein
MPKIEEDRLVRVGARLGEAVLDPTAWPGLMEEICRAVGAVGSALLQGDIRTPDIPRTKSVDEIFRKYFADGWHIRDVRAQRGVPTLLRGETVVVDQDLFTQDEMRSDPFYSEWLRSQGLQWFSAVGFWAGSSLWGLTIQRTPREGPFDVDDKRVIARISERLTEAATLSKAVGQQVLFGISNALDLVRQPAIVLDRLGFVLDANRTVEQLFGDELRVRQKRVWVRDQSARHHLDRLADQMRARPDSEVLHAAPIVVQRVRCPPMLIHVLPIPAPARSPFLGARTLLIISDLGSKRSPDPTLLRQLFNLTRMESRVASIVSTGASPEKAAEELGIACETARNHLKAAYSKTGTHRQSELSSLLSRATLLYSNE